MFKQAKVFSEKRISYELLQFIIFLLEHHSTINITTRPFYGKEQTPLGDWHNLSFAVFILASFSIW